MKLRKNALAVFCIGCLGYSVIELAWRKHTHWTMALTGGTCFVLLHRLFSRFYRLRLWQKCTLGAASITGLELAVGCVVNRLLKWNVWDYSARPGNVLGQICPLYTLLWSLLCVPLVAISGFLRRRLHLTA